MKKSLFIRSVAFFPFILVFVFKVEAQDWPGLGRYREANQKLKVKGGKRNKAVFMGDSITDFWLGDSTHFFEKNGYIDRGISAQTSPKMLLRFRSDVIDLNPKVVVILCGINDIAGNSGPSSLEMIEDNISGMAQLARANHIKVILCSLLPANKLPWKPEIAPADLVIALNQWIKAYARDNHYGWCDYYSDMVDDNKGLKKAYSEDGIHPNQAGYLVMDSIVQKAIQSMLR